MSSGRFSDRRVAELASGAQFVLWCLRARVDCRRSGQDPAERLARAFRIAHMPGWEEPFERIFRWLDTTAVCTVRVGCLRCARVTPEEAALLGALSAFQACDAATGEGQMAELLPPAAARSSALTVQSLAQALNAAELPVTLQAEAGAASQPIGPEPQDAIPPGLFAPSSNLVH